MLIIGGEAYSFLAAWSSKLAYKGETVCFDWEWDESGKYRNAALVSSVARTKSGNEVRRGERGSKPWRTADNRLPVRRSEWKD